MRIVLPLLVPWWTICYLAGALVRAPVSLALAVVPPYFALGGGPAVWWWWLCILGVASFTLPMVGRLALLLVALTNAWRPGLFDPLRWTSQFAFTQGSRATLGGGDPMGLPGSAATVSGLVILLLSPILILKVLGGVVAGAWLLVLGEWPKVGLGLLIAVFGAQALALPLAPSAALGLPAVALLERSQSMKSVTAVLGFALWFLANAYTAALMTATSLLIFHFMTSGATDASLLPSLVLAYSASVVPWFHMAKVESDMAGAELASGTPPARSWDFTWQTVIVLMMALFAVLLMALLGDPSRLDLVIVVASFMAANVVLSLPVVISTSIRQLRRRQASSALCAELCEGGESSSFEASAEQDA